MADIVVLGSGILGLTLANKLSDQYKVVVVARDLGNDLKSQAFASPWAGANWASYAINQREQQWDTDTYLGFFDLMKERPDLCELIQFYDAEHGSNPSPPWYSGLVKDYEVLTDPAKVPKPNKSVRAYKSFILNPPRLLQHLTETLTSKGVRFIRHTATSLDELYNLPQVGPVRLVVNASGLGARTLKGVEDPDVYAIRGQTALVKAPGVKTCYMRLVSARPETTSKEDEHEAVYTIPRAGPEGHVILGGCFQVENYNREPDMALHEWILQQNFQTCPALASASSSATPTWKDIEVVSINVGFRPARKGGCRLELQELDQGKAALHAYGIGPAGYQASIGIAKEGVALVNAWWQANLK